MAVSSKQNVAHFAALEASFGVPAALAADDYLRVMAASVSNSPLAAIPSEEGTPGRDRVEVFSGRPKSSLTMTTLFRGAPSTASPPVHGRLIESALGGDPIAVAAAGDVTGAAAGRVLFVAGATDGMLRPQLGGAAQPLIATAGAAVYRAVAYPLAADHKSLTVRRQPLEAGAQGAPAQLVGGWKINQLTLAFDASGSPGTLEFSGPAARTWHGAGAVADGGAGAAVAIPAAVSDDQPLSGIPAKMWFRRRGAAAFMEMSPAFRTLNLTIDNHQVLRDDEAGSLYGTGVIDEDNRTATLTLTTYAEEEQALYADIREGMAAGTPREYSLFFALGAVEGSRAGLYVARWKPDLPSGSDEARIAWSFSGLCLADTYSAGDSSLALGLG